MPSNFTKDSIDLDDLFLLRSDTIFRNQYPIYRVQEFWSWGYNASGQLGLGDVIHRSSPVQVGSLTDWKSIISGLNESLAIKTDGTLWSWGDNRFGQLGLGDVTTDRSSPIKVGSLTDWKSIGGSGQSSLAIKTDGTLWSWGHNSHGQLGLNDITDRSSPVQVDSSTDWSLISVGIGFHTLAIKTDGTLWSWGHNTYGQLGSSTRTHRSIPVKVGSLNDWSLISVGNYHSLAIKTDGTLWSWGDNSYGELGLADLIHRSSPVKVGSLTDWSLINANGYFSLAIKTDGTLWSWGYNFDGQLGLGDITNRSSPVQVGNLTNWKSISGSYCSLAIKTDGTLWGWGHNTYGQLGFSNRTRVSIPTQVGRLNEWVLISNGGGHSLAIKFNV